MAAKEPSGSCEFEDDDKLRRTKGFDSKIQHFRQKQGTRVCMSIAFCNMIHHMDGGGIELAEKFYQVAGNKEYGPDWILDLQHDLRHIFPHKKLKKISLSSFDMMSSSVRKSEPMLVQLRKTGNCIDHCVGILGGEIFDSCNDFTLPRTMEFLDHVCRPMKFFKCWKIVQLVDDPAAFKDKLQKQQKRKLKFKQKCKEKSEEAERISTESIKQLTSRSYKQRQRKKARRDQKVK